MLMWINTTQPAHLRWIMSLDNHDNALIASVQGTAAPGDDFARIGAAIQELTQHLETRYRELQRIVQITARVNAGLFLDEVLEGVYHDFKDFIPYDRIGFSLIEEDGTSVKARWAKAEYGPLRLARGYSAELAGSTLETVINSGQPRIINNLEAYSLGKPESLSTRLILEEGIRSSLTCPLIANGTPVGFMFFSSRKPNMYASIHVDIFQQIAGQLSVMVEKGRLVAELAAQKLELEQKNEELRRLNDLKNSFLGVAAHDLRNPISNIQTAMSLMMDKSYSLTPEQQEQILSDIDQQTHYMLNLLDDLLDVSHIESGKFTLNPVPLALGTFLEEVVQRHNSLAEGKGSAVRLESAAAGEAMADPLRLRQVMDNLISNAVKYSPPGSVTRVRAGLENGDWRVEVQDQGPGITPEDQARLFQDFARLSARPTGGEKSTGLGLAISRRVVEAHHGCIGVHSEEGHGATFWFTLKPVERPVQTK
jgi:signal transduction histidine kinase